MQCEVIRDLLPLYQDELCSPVTAELVRQHLAECPDCARAAERMRSQVHVEERPVIRAESPFYVYQKKVFLRTVLAVLATLAVCFAAFCGVDTTIRDYGPINSMADVDSILPYAREAMAWCAEQGIMTGGLSGNKAYALPESPATRAQTTKIMTVLTRDVVNG